LHFVIAEKWRQLQIRQPFEWCHYNVAIQNTLFHIKVQVYATLMRVRLRVKEVAEVKGISMTRLHTKSEVAYNTIRRIFRDPYSEVTTTTLARLAEALGVSTAELIEDIPGPVNHTSNTMNT
jgi:DNA-binding Xre family transcriptional regulator